MLYFYLFFTGVFILILSALSLFSMSVKIMWNCGLLVAMRLLLARAIAIASLSICSSSCVNMDLSLRVGGSIPAVCVVVDGACSVKPERQKVLRVNPVSPARLDQPR